MNETITHFLRDKCIDSFQKLRILLFMHQYPHQVGSYRQLAEQLYLGETPLLEQALNDLQRVGLINQEMGRCRLSEAPEVKASLHELTRVFADPLARQTLLHKLKNLHWR